MDKNREKLLKHYLALLEYEIALRDAADDLIRFAEVTMPESRFPDDVTRSKYKAARHHRFMADLMMRVESGEKKKVIINTAPRHGKSEICTRRFGAWFSARNPGKDVIVATYGKDFAADFSKDIREIFDSFRFKQVFPEFHLTQASNEMMITSEGGRIYFLGRRSPTTGRGGDLILVDDPTKDDKEVRSDLFRDDVWQWFTQTLLTRRHNDQAAIAISQCMTGDTPVMRPDGTEILLRDIRPGNRIATYDNGKLAASTVLGFKNCGPDDTLKIRMTSGATVRANARHPFLIERNGRLEWIRVKNIRRSDAIVRVSGGSGRGLRASGTDVANRPNAEDSARHITIGGAGPQVIAHHQLVARKGLRANSNIGTALRFKTTIGYLKTKAADALYALAIPPRLATQSTGGTFFALTTATKPERSEGFSATIATSLLAGARRQKHWSEWPLTSDFTLDKVVEITPDVREDVFDIMVDRTENFIANGLVSHNTRWHDDDIVGRLTDKTNPAYSPKFAKDFEIINLPAIADEDDVLGRKTGEALWPERFGIKYLEEMRDVNPPSFAALYQSDPTPEDGIYFTVDELTEYDRDELPTTLTKYAVSDHAVATRALNDPTCLMPFGICERGIAWVLPNIVWKRMNSMEAVEQMLQIIMLEKPVFWYAEKGHISKSIGPFLKKRMEEENIYVPVIEDQPIGDKQQRAQSGRARCAQGMIRFPKFASWWGRAKSELLKFPNGRHDDFVDCISMIGMKVGTQTAPGRVQKTTRHLPGTFGYMLDQFKQQDAQEAFEKDRSGW